MTYKKLKNENQSVVSCWLSVIGSAVKQQIGFTLLEAMLSIFILLVGVTAAMALVSGGIKGLTFSKSRLIALNLAQEGLEVMHNVRDNNWLNSDNLGTPPSWNDWFGGGSASSCPLTTPCTGYVWWSSDDLVSGGEPANLIRWNTATNHYDYNGTVGESFSRIITITDNPDINVDTADVSVKTTVGWGGSATDTCTISGVTVNKKYCIQVEEHLYDWR